MRKLEEVSGETPRDKGGANPNLLEKKTNGTNLKCKHNGKMQTIITIIILHGVCACYFLVCVNPFPPLRRITVIVFLAAGGLPECQGKRLIGCTFVRCDW